MLQHYLSLLPTNYPPTSRTILLHHQPLSKPLATAKNPSNKPFYSSSITGSAVPCLWLLLLLLLLLLMLLLLLLLLLLSWVGRFCLG